MSRKTKRYLYITIALIIFSFLFTILVKFVDVKAIGPNSSSVGFATLNGFFHKLIGVNFSLYKLTDICGIATLALVAFFAVVGIVQWIQTKHLLDVDKNILALGIFYILTFIVYLFFEFVVINRRPVLIDSKLEASYPSSTTMLALTILVTTIFQVKKYVSHDVNKIVCYGFCGLYSAFLIICRIMSGVHWISDILGAIIISTTLIILYVFLDSWFNDLEKKKKSNL